MTRRNNILMNFNRDCNVDKKAQLIYNPIIKTDDFIAFILSNKLKNKLNKN